MATKKPPKLCQWCNNGIAAVELTYIFGKGERYRFVDALCVKEAGVRETGDVCGPCATEAIAGDDPPWDHRYFNKPKQVRGVDETPRFFEGMGLS